MCMYNKVQHVHVHVHVEEYTVQLCTAVGPAPYTVITTVDMLQLRKKENERKSIRAVVLSVLTAVYTAVQK